MYFSDAPQIEEISINQIAGGHPNLKDGVCKGRPPLSWNCLVFYDKTSLHWSSVKEKVSILLSILYNLTILNSHNGTSVILSLIHISEPTRLGMISYAVFC